MVFKLNDKESKKYRKFDIKHSKCREKKDSMGTSNIVCEFRATGLGEIIKVRCLVCGKEKDITDCESW